MSTTLMSSASSAPLSRPDTVIAACSSSSRIEKLLLVAGVQPSAANPAPTRAISLAQADKRWASICAGLRVAATRLFMRLNVTRVDAPDWAARGYDKDGWAYASGEHQ